MMDYYIRSKFFQNRDKVRYTGPPTDHIQTGEVFSVRFGRSDGWIKVVRLRADKTLHYVVIWHKLLTLVRVRQRYDQDAAVRDALIPKARGA